MRKTLGIVCIALGVLCLLGSVGFVLYNRMEAESARESSQELLREVQSVLAATQPPEPVAPEGAEPEPASQELPAVEFGGYECLGILAIPALELDLPVLADWSYEKLQVAPCHYFGSCADGNFVIAAHNYPAHFGRLRELQPEDVILFTDLTGGVHGYEVVLQETLAPTATQEMITSGFDLSLYTCTPGGGSRVTVRCQKMT